MGIMYMYNEIPPRLQKYISVIPLFCESLRTEGTDCIHLSTIQNMLNNTVNVLYLACTIFGGISILAIQRGFELAFYSNQLNYT